MAINVKAIEYMFGFESKYNCLITFSTYRSKRYGEIIHLCRTVCPTLNHSDVSPLILTAAYCLLLRLFYEFYDKDREPYFNHDPLMDFMFNKIKGFEVVYEAGIQIDIIQRLNNNHQIHIAFFLTNTKSFILLHHNHASYRHLIICYLFIFMNRSWGTIRDLPLWRARRQERANNLWKKEGSITNSNAKSGLGGDI